MAAETQVIDGKTAVLWEGIRRVRAGSMAAKAGSRTYDMVYAGMFAVLIAICAWISIPFVIPVTLQTFAVFLTMGVLGGRLGTTAIVIYVLLGSAGLPVFSGFAGGMGVLLGNTGGYIWGFILSALLMWAIERVFGRNKRILAVSMVLGLLACYLSGTVWFMLVYVRNGGIIGAAAVLAWCVFPFIIPDLLKLSLALMLSKHLVRVKKNFCA